VAWLYRRVTTALFTHIYITSHKAWLKRHSLGAHWSECKTGFEYSLEITLPIDPVKRPPRIALRQTSKPIASIEFIFAADAGGVVYQHKVHAINVESKPVIISLDSVPTQDVPRVDESGVSFTWRSYRLLNIQVSFKDGTSASEAETIRSSLTHTWFLQSTWVLVNGVRLNADAIRRAQEDIARYFTFGFGRPRIVVYSLRPSRRQPRRQFIKYYLSRPVAWICQQSVTAKILFWCAIWSKNWKFTDEGELMHRNQWNARASSSSAE
jgi:hypothetical protein